MAPVSIIPVELSALVADRRRSGTPVAAGVPLRSVEQFIV